MEDIEGMLTRERAIEAGINPMGHTFFIQKVEGTSLIECVCKDGRVAIPDRLGGKWTNRRMLEDEMKFYLTEAWNMSDAKSEANARKLARKTHAENVAA